MSNRQERRAEEKSTEGKTMQYASSRPSRIRNAFVLFIVGLFVAGTVLPSVLSLLDSDDEDVDPIVLNQLIAQRRAECSGKASELPNSEDLTAPEVTLLEGEVTELITEDIKEGEGNPVESGDCVVINYHGNLAGGLVFDTSFVREEPFNRTNPFATIIGESNVIQGWDQGIIGLKKGGIRKLTIPPSLAYGENRTGLYDQDGNLIKDVVNTEQDIDPTAAVDNNGDGRADYIPENAALVFYVELVDIFDVGELPGSN